MPTDDSTTPEFRLDSTPRPAFDKRAYMKAHYEANKEARRDYQKAYYRANKQTENARAKVYRAVNKEAIAEGQKAWRESQKEKIQARAKVYRAANKEAIAEGQKARYRANKETILAKKRAYNEAHKEEIQAQRKARREADRGKFNARDRTGVIRRKYGLTPDEVAAMLEGQKGRCWICRQPFGSKSPHIDHCHATGKVRGLLCRECNLGLAHFADDSKSLMRAARYLKSAVKAVKADDATG